MEGVRGEGAEVHADLDVGLHQLRAHLRVRVRVRVRVMVGFRVRVYGLGLWFMCPRI